LNLLTGLFVHYHASKDPSQSIRFNTANRCFIVRYSYSIDGSVIFHFTNFQNPSTVIDEHR
jgi:hypothetical protein